MYSNQTAKFILRPLNYNIFITQETQEAQEAQEMLRFVLIASFAPFASFAFSLNQKFTQSILPF
ncbi:MAG: hypothetical protein DRR16_01915 [Candidatus Parabeggiatoa sp. nov. 3]|nr:MAG: hypothetical protein DRR00_11855 [Gammaproteobacteria bacterium]RKZ67168.1 MAG: hypothetical protein DRQ99_07465 [Gammaproteobacteria bacterium]RKZ89728.1 MAG: hypothetical protein DRR16_01915 [Gammaproteobacteria bacterium]